MVEGKYSEGEDLKKLQSAITENKDNMNTFLNDHCNDKRLIPFFVWHKSFTFITNDIK
jgi:hypothetical protein